MIHVATVHWKQERWIPIQQRYFKRFMGEPYRVYSFFTEIDERFHQDFYFSVESDVQMHAEKLNMLADIIAQHADSEDDLLLFIDGDAFPIADISSYAKSRLKDHPLAAVQRIENVGDVQPHPCFCLTTVGFWRWIKGDWNKGFMWKASTGQWRTDVGGNLLGLLSDAGVNWWPILRSNPVNLHPLLFGIYDDVVYHHGASFRTPFTFVDGKEVRDSLTGLSRLLKWLGGGYPRRWPLPLLLPDRAYRGFKAKKLERLHRNEELSKEVLGWIESDPEFYQRLLTPSA